MVDHERTDVFISYAREDRQRVRTLAKLFEARGLSVWWDWNLIGGSDFRSEIRERIERAGKVVVLWSRHSVRSAFVLDEAAHARALGKLVPLVVDDVELPYGFGQLHALDAHDPEAAAEAVAAALGNPAERSPTRVPGRQPADPGRRRLLAVAGVAGLGVAAGAWFIPRLELPAKDRVNRIALVVGNESYERLAKLDSAMSDARDISGALRDRDFKVMEVRNAGRAELQNAIGRFKTMLSLGGVGLFYYAGHAARVRDSDYIFPIDAFVGSGDLPSSGDELVEAAIQIDDVTGPIGNFFAQRDTAPLRVAGLCIGASADCAAGNGADAVATDAAPVAPLRVLPPANSTRMSGLTARELQTIRDQGVFMMYSAAEGEVAMDWVSAEDENSPFAEALLVELADGDGELSALASRVRRRVRASTQGLQNPVLENRSDAPFYFNRRSADPEDGVLRIVLLDSCRGNPFAQRDSR